MSIIKLLIPSIVILLVGVVLAGNNKAYATNVPYSIIYDDNVTSNMPTDVDTTSMSEQVTMANNTPTRPGFKYLGWCNVIPTSSGGTDLCTGGTTYQPSATLTIDQTGTNNFHFYAMWGEETQSSCYTSPMISTVASGITYMQDINSGNKSTVLSALAQDATYQIKDNRDNETYCVGKLADGNLWLLDNLALDLTSSTVLSGMNESNTHASNTTLNYLKNGGGTTSDKYAITGVVNWTDSPTYASSRSYSDPLVNLTNKDIIPSDATSQAGQYKVGGYYNYCAATAGSYCYGNGTSVGTSSGNATEDICPKGWRMPTGDTTGEYQALYNNASYNTYANYRSALRLPLSGHLPNGSADHQGSDGFWWSSTRDNNLYMYYLGANTSRIYPVNEDDRTRGYSVRCVLGS